jgi:hypothetical protein
MKAYLIQIYDEDMNKKISEIKETKGISIQDQFRKGLKLLIVEMERGRQDIKCCRSYIVVNKNLFCFFHLNS